MVETKRYARINDLATPIATSPAATAWALRNVFAPMMLSGGGGGQGPASYQIIGNEIVNPLMKCKFTWYLNWNSIRATQVNYSSVALNVYLVAANDQTLNQTESFVDASGIANLDIFYNASGYNPTFNGNNVKVLARWRRLVTPDQTAVAAVQGYHVVRGSMRYRWKRKITFEDFATIPAEGGPGASSFVRGWNYYLVVGSALWGNLTAGAGVLESRPVCYFDQFMYYKDP